MAVPEEARYTEQAWDTRRSRPVELSGRTAGRRAVVARTYAVHRADLDYFAEYEG